jgi:surface protein
MIKQIFLIGLATQMLLAVTPQPIQIGETIISNVEYKDKKYYTVTVPQNKSINITLTHLSADVDLYIKANELPRIRNNDCYSSNSNTDNEECSYTATGNKLKKINIMVYGFKTADFTLKSSLEDPKEIKTLSLDKIVKGHINRNKFQDYKFLGEKGVRYKIDLNELSADADLRVKIGQKATKHRFDCKSTNGGQSIDSCEITLKSNEPIYVNIDGYRTADYQLILSKITNSNPPITLARLKEMIINGEDVTKVNTSQIIDMSGLFTLNRGVNGFFNQDISKWDVSNVTNMANMFYQTQLFNQDIGKWDVSNVTNMSNMFSMSKSFNQDISKWNVSKVTNMSGMFSDIEGFNQDISRWDVSNVTNMNKMFNNYYSCPYENHDLSRWNVSSVIEHEDFISEVCKNNIEPKWKN